MVRVGVGVWLLVTVVGLARAMGAQAGGVRVEASGEAMGTTFTVVLHGDDHAQLERVAREALDEAIRLDNLLSNYKPESEWSRVNRDAGRRSVRVSEELFGVIAASVEYGRLTDGAFDITVGPLVRAWGFFGDDGSVANPATLERARANVGYRHVRLDRAALTVAFDRPELELDPGGIGKGYAVDRMAAIIRVHGVSAAFVSAGGSSIYARGAPPDEPRGWPVTIRAPTGADVAVFLSDASLSTSGGAEKFFRAGGRVHTHIMDPRTGGPATGTTLVSVIAPTTIDSEVWATAIFVHGRVWARRHRPDGFRVFVCEDGAPGACQWVE